MPKAAITTQDLHRASGTVRRAAPRSKHHAQPQRSVPARQFDAALARELARRTIHQPTFNEGSEP